MCCRDYRLFWVLIISNLLISYCCWVNAPVLQSKPVHISIQTLANVDKVTLWFFCGFEASFVMSARVIQGRQLSGRFNHIVIRVEISLIKGVGLWITWGFEQVKHLADFARCLVCWRLNGRTCSCPLFYVKTFVCINKALRPVFLDKIGSKLLLLAFLSSLGNLRFSLDSVWDCYILRSTRGGLFRNQDRGVSSAGKR